MEVLESGMSHQMAAHLTLDILCIVESCVSAVESFKSWLISHRKSSIEDDECDLIKFGDLAQDDREEKN